MQVFDAKASSPVNASALAPTDKIVFGDISANNWGTIELQNFLEALALNAASSASVGATGKALLGASNGAALRAILGSGTADSTTVLQGDGLWILKSSITTTDASLLTSGTLLDARLSSNVPLKNAANVFSAQQTITAANPALTINATGGDVPVVRLARDGTAKWSFYCNSNDEFAIAPFGAGGNPLTIGPSTGTVTLTPLSSSAQGLVIHGAASQSANLQEWQGSNGAVLANVTATGKIGTCAASTFTSVVGGIDLNVVASPGTTGIQYYANNLQFFLDGGSKLNVTNTEYRIPSGSYYAWSENADNFGSSDTALLRVSAGIIANNDLGRGNDVGFRFQRKSSTTNDRDVGQILGSWAVATDASRAGQISIGAYLVGSLQAGVTVTARSGSPLIAMGGGVTPASLADSSAANSTIYYSTDAGKLVFKDSGGVVNNLY